MTGATFISADLVVVVVSHHSKSIYLSPWWPKGLSSISGNFSLFFCQVCSIWTKKKYCLRTIITTSYQLEIRDCPAVAVAFSEGAPWYAGARLEYTSHSPGSIQRRWVTSSITSLHSFPSPQKICVETLTLFVTRLGSEGLSGHLAPLPPWTP